MEKLLDFANDRAIGVGVLGTITSWGASVAAICQAANLVLGLIAGVLGCCAAVFTLLVSYRRWQLTRSK